MSRTVIKEAEEILDVKIQVLDKGFVCLVDYMGGDERVVSAARVSYGKHATTPERDALLIDYLLANEHTSPFEQVVLTYHMRVPMFIDRQIVRHRTQRRSEISGRYTKLPNDYYIPDAWRAQDYVNRQGSVEDTDGIVKADYAHSIYEESCKKSFFTYEELLRGGVAKEMARMAIPLSTYTEYYIQFDLHNLFHFLKLRLDTNAQWEVRQYAEVMLDMAQRVAPVSCAAFKKYIINSVRISREEYESLKRGAQDEKV